jgi:para-nitrobenzyl esterase
MKKCRYIITTAIVLFCFAGVTNLWAKGPPGHAKNDNNRHNTKVQTKYGRWAVKNRWAKRPPKHFKNDYNCHHTEVLTKYGRLTGILDANNTWAWKGVPYAKPPVGDLRWKAPQDPEPWKGVKQAKDECEPCTQLETTPQWIRYPYAIGSEDCLYLNIWRPRSDEINLPVYVWIHGGSNNFGMASQYNGSVIASRSNVVVVVLQYRLGPIGWLTHPALRHGDPEDDSGNFGTLDNIQALKWIQKNIRAFGGDPKNVLITGESAGAHNVMNLVISPLAAGLFHKAMSESGGMTTDTVAEGEAQAEDTIAALLVADGLTEIPGNDVEAYLRGKTSHEIFEAYYASYHTLPTYDAYQDGHVIPGSVVSTIRSGIYNKVPIILGANEFETKSFMPLYGPALGLPWNNLIAVLDGDIPSVDDVLPTENDKDLYELSGYYGSRNWRAKFVDERARALKDNQEEDVYAYQFNWGGPGSGPTPFDFIYGAGHAMEIAFFFGSDTSMWGYSYSPGNDTKGRVDLQDKMMAYLANFAHYGNPNGPGLFEWNQWSNVEDEPKVIVFDSDFDNAQIVMDNEEVLISEVYSTYYFDISARQLIDPAFWSFTPGVGWGWVPGYFQWQTAE